MDGNEERVLQTRLGVRGYPSIYLFRDGRMWSYSGARTVQAITAWASGEYKQTSAAPFHKTPNNVLGRCVPASHISTRKARLVLTAPRTA